MVLIAIRCEKTRCEKKAVFESIVPEGKLVFVAAFGNQFRSFI